MHPPDYEIVSGSEFVEAIQNPSLARLEFPLVDHVYQRQGWVSGPRRLDSHILWYMDEGRFEGTIRQTPIVVKPGMFVWISSRVANDFSSIGTFSSLTVRFTMSRNEMPMRLASDYEFLEGKQELRNLMHRIIMAMKFKQPHEAALVRSLLCLLIIEALNSIQLTASEKTASRTGFNPGNLRILDEFLTQNLSGPITAMDLARSLRLNPDYFSRKFRVHFGCSPRVWLSRERIRKACSLLHETNHSIKEIADSLGYTDQHFFSRQFRKVKRITPSEFRRQQ